MILGVVALCVYLVDQTAKLLVVANLYEGQQFQVLGQLLQFHFVKNAGAAFSIGTGSTWIFSIVGVGVLGFVIWYAPRIRSTAWAVLFGLLLGGLLGNLTDRLFREPGFGVGHVVDFLQIPVLPAIFNLADVAIVSSMVLFLLLTLRGVGLDGRHAPDGDVDPESESVAGDPASESVPGDPVAGEPVAGGPVAGEPTLGEPKQPIANQHDKPQS
ncbi:MULTISPECIES: signal peptidase II [unclassified Leifsonia]|uniref:signal peptidase II n=1 Tax=unclassified Leifsonia TaxID=2663824 RepID=UPI0008A7BD16|nr:MULTISPECIES: signal peptidase II [unclassified Leifsonia]SEH97909.1 signal peptidase II [Leifsonia sp. CL154]SFL62370.1 signal peptidase II [Leifsonia sp. CL147]